MRQPRGDWSWREAISPIPTEPERARYVHFVNGRRADHSCAARTSLDGLAGNQRFFEAWNGTAFGVRPGDLLFRTA